MINRFSWRTGLREEDTEILDSVEDSIFDSAFDSEALECSRVEEIKEEVGLGDTLF